MRHRQVFPGRGENASRSRRNVRLTPRLPTARSPGAPMRRKRSEQKGSSWVFSKLRVLAKAPSCSRPFQRPKTGTRVCRMKGVLTTSAWKRRSSLWSRLRMAASRKEKREGC